ncbi:MAG TPA: asparagine synthase-related protein [Longimicrobiaceae bacterium]|nr:asparagine synthase-related protein [Longimicrobiaceae bacterium]
MSDFLFTARRREPGALRRQLEAYLAPVADFAEHHGDWGSLAVALGPHDPPEVVVEDGGWLSVLVGEPVVRIAPEPPGLSWRGSRRRLLHGLLREDRERDWSAHLDGHFAALAVDTGSGMGWVLTDLFAFVPVFLSTDGEGGLVIGTHVDAVARAAGRGRDVDPVSATDFAATLTCTFPYTLFRGVEQALPGTARRFGRDGWQGSGHTFWRPAERPGAFATVRDAAAALRAAVERDVRTACDGLPEVGLLLSGGEDSRAVLGAVPPGPEVRAFVYADWESREVRVARAVARAYGVALTVGWRGPSHYLDGFETAASMVGGHHLFMDVHGYGFHQRLGIRELPVVLGGLSSDSLLKGEYAVPRATGPVSVPRAPMLREELLREVEARRTAFRDRLAELRPGSADEWLVLWPLCMRKHGGNVDGNRRLFRAHEVYHSTAVLEVAAAVPAAWKLHRRLFHLAMRPFLARTRWVPHSKARYPAFGRWGNLLLAPGLAAARGARALLTGQLRARHGPWPRFSAVAGSAAAEQWRREHPLLDTPLRGIFVPAPAAEVEAGVERWHPLRRLILLQLTHLAMKAQSE